jgi:hypothetical protein
MLQNAKPNRIPPASLVNVEVSVNTIANVTGSVESKGANSLVNREINWLKK